MNLYLMLLTLQFLLNLFIYFNIPILRQIMGFIYLTFIPGFIILMQFKKGNFDLIEKITFSVGLSISFLMFSGLLLNEILPIFGIIKPLSTGILIASLSIFIIPLCLIKLLYRKSHEQINLNMSFFNLIKVLSFTLLPMMSIFGTFFMEISKNNLIVLLIIGISAILITLIIFFKNDFSVNIYPIALISIYVSMLFIEWLSTKYILGWDSHGEFYSFNGVEEASLWSFKKITPDIDKSTTMLSVTILPTIYTKILDIDGVWVFKIIYPLLVSCVPIILYRLFLCQTKRENAFLASFFFISNALTGLGSFKQWIATIFFCLSYYIIFSKKFPSSVTKPLLIIFGASLVVSHYSLSYLFMFIISLFLIFSHLLKKNSIMKSQLSLFLFTYIVMAFSWYIYCNKSVIFDITTNTVAHIFDNFIEDLFSVEARGQTVVNAIQLESSPTYVHLMSKLIFYLTNLLIIIGFFSKLKKRKNDRDILVLAFLHILLLGLTVIVPNLAETFGIRRFYRIAIIILAPFFVYGCESLANLLSKGLNKRLPALFLVLTTLVPFFLFQTGFVYEITKTETWSISLGRYRMPQTRASQWIIYDEDAASAIWLKQASYNNTIIYSDYISKSHVLTSYSQIDWNQIKILRNTTESVEKGSLVYLSSVNTVESKMLGDYVLPEWDISNVSFLIIAQNIIYTNGASEIYKNSN